MPDRNEALPDGVPLEVTFRTAGGLPGCASVARTGCGRERSTWPATVRRWRRPTPCSGARRRRRAGPAAPGERGGRSSSPASSRCGAPAVVLRRPITEGESVEHVVVRSDHDVAPADYAAANGDEADAERHIVPSKVAMQDAELLRCFDEAIGQAIRPPSTGPTPSPCAKPARSTATTCGTLTWVPSGRSTASRTSRRTPDDPNSGYVIHTEDELEVPYLPDPWSPARAWSGCRAPRRHVIRIGADGTSTTEPDEPRLDPRPQPGVLIVGWGGRDPWWTGRPLRLRVVEGDGPPGWEAATRVLTVSLPKAVQADVQISSVLDEHHLDEHGAWRAVMRRVASSGAAIALYVQLARTGRLWAVTPARTVRLVHALQRPLHAPGRHRAARPSRARGDVGDARRRGPPARREHRPARRRGDVGGPGRRSRSRRASGPRAEEHRACLSQQILLARDVAAEPRSAEVQTARFVEADDLLVLGPLRHGPSPTVHVGPRAAQHPAPAHRVHGDGDVTLPRVLPAGALPACPSC